MIEIQCTSCHTRYRIDERVLPEDTPTFKCSRCGHVFNADSIPAKPRKAAPTPEPEPAPVRTPRSRASALKPPVASEQDPQFAPEQEPPAPHASSHDSEPVHAPIENTAESHRQHSDRFGGAREEKFVDEAFHDEPAAKFADKSLDRASASEAAAHEAAARARSEEREPLDRTFGDREQKSEAGENLKFDFSQDDRTDAHEIDETADERAFSARERGGAEWQVGDTAAEFDTDLNQRGRIGGGKPDPFRRSPSVAAEFGSTAQGRHPRFAGRVEEEAAPEEFDIENIDPAIAALAEPRKIYSWGYFIVLYFFVAVGFLGASVLICGEPVASARLLGEVPKLGEYFARPILPSMLVALHDVRAEYRTLKGGQPALVVSGTAENVGNGRLKMVQIVVDLLGDSTRSVARQGVYAGNELSTKMLDEMTPREIEFSQGLSPRESFAMEPTASAPFLTVFINPPKQLAQLRISVSKAIAADASPPVARAASRD